MLSLNPAIGREVRAFAGSTLTLTAVAGGSHPFSYQWLVDGVSIPGANQSTLTLRPVTAGAQGSYRVRLSNSAGEALSSETLVTVLPETEAPRVVSELNQNLVLSVSDPLVLSPNLSGPPADAYQWFKDGVAIRGAVSPVFNGGPARDSDAGMYELETSRLGISLRFPIAWVRIAPDARVRLTNLSIRINLDPEKQAAVIGLVSDGSFSAPYLLRAAGPSLDGFGVSNFARDPELAVFSGQKEVERNQDWGDDAFANWLSLLFARVGAFGFASPLSADAALVIPFSGSRTIQLRPAANTVGGTSLLEAYDLYQTRGSELINLSALARTGSGSEALILGFAVKGPGKSQFLFRAVGPGLRTFGIGDFSIDPRIKLERLDDGRSTTLATNDNWTDNTETRSAFSKAGAFSLTRGSADACLVVELGAGLYSLTVSDAGDGEGRTLAEAYILR